MLREHHAPGDGEADAEWRRRDTNECCLSLLPGTPAATPGTGVGHRREGSQSHCPWTVTSVIFTETFELAEAVLSTVGVKFKLVRSDSSAVSMTGPDSPPRIS